MPNNSATKKQDIPFINGLFLLLVWLDKPLAYTNKAPVHETTLQQVVNGFEQKRSTLIGQATFPLAILFTWDKADTNKMTNNQTSIFW